MSRDGGRRQEPDEPWFKSKFSLAILGSCGTMGFVISTFRSHMTSVTALGREWLTLSHGLGGTPCT